MTSQMENLKQWLKDTAEQIRNTRKALKEYQRQHNGCDHGDYRKLWLLAYEYRHRHIAYSELRGRSRDEIERPGEKHLPNEAYIQTIKDQITNPAPQAEQAVS